MHFKPLKIFPLPNSIYIQSRRWLQQKMDFLPPSAFWPLKIKNFTSFILTFFTRNCKILNFGAVPGTLFIYFVIFLTIHTHYSSSGCSPAGYSFFLSWVTDSCIWANNFLPAGPRVGCRAGFEPRAAVQQPSTLTTKPCCTFTQNCKILMFYFIGIGQNVDISSSKRL
jgi:hypothetical protein